MIRHKPDCDADLRTSGCVCEAASPRVVAGHVLKSVDYDADYLWECECNALGEDLHERDVHLVRAVLAIIDEHIPSLTEKAENLIDERTGGTDALWMPEDWADLAVRECPCGVMVDGFYEYVDHLRQAIGGASVV